MERRTIISSFQFHSSSMNIFIKRILLSHLYSYTLFSNHLPSNTIISKSFIKTTNLENPRPTLPIYIFSTRISLA